MDVAYINPFLIASREVFRTMVHLELDLGRPYLKRANETQNILTAVVNLDGPVSGMVLLGFSQPVALAVASGLSGQPLKGLDGECLDALGEVANMIVGGAKKAFPAECPATMSTPKIYLGVNNVPYPKGQPFIVLPCETPKGRFVIEVTLITARTAAGLPAGAAAPATTRAPEAAPPADTKASAPAPDQPAEAAAATQAA